MFPQEAIRYVSFCNPEALTDAAPADAEILYVDIGGVSDESGISEVEPMLFADAPSRARRIVRDGDVIVSTVRTYLRAIAPIEAPPANMIVSTGFAVLRPDGKKIDSRFFGYALRAEPLIDSIVANSVGVSYPAIKSSTLTSLKISLPDLDRQRKIVAFLDDHLAVIDEGVSKYMRLVDLIAEKRSALVDAAISGLALKAKSRAIQRIPWSPPFPASWGVKRNKWLFREVNDRSKDGRSELLSVSHITGVTPRSEKNVYMFMAETLEGYKICRAGDLVVNTMWAWMGALGISPCDGLVSPSYNVYRLTSDEISPQYYDLVARSTSQVSYVKAISTGVWESRLRLYPRQFLNLLTAIPSKDEQAAIVAQVAREAQYLEPLTKKVHQCLTLLRKRRSALITAAVAGDIDVNSYAAVHFPEVA